MKKEALIRNLFNTVSLTRTGVSLDGRADPPQMEIFLWGVTLSQFKKKHLSFYCSEKILVIV